MAAVIVRLVLALLLAPISALLAIGVLTVLYGLVFDHEFSEIALNFQMFAVYGLLIAYVGTVVFGIPINLFLRKIDKASVMNHALVGAFLGLLFGVFFFRLGETFGENPVVSLVYFGFAVFPGATVAAVFAAIAGKGRANQRVADAT